MGDALAHGVLPGIAVAFIVGIDIAIGAFLSAIIMVIGINLVNRASKLSADTGIGLLFVGMLALGVVIISRTRSFTGDLTSFLFGSVLGVKNSDIWLQSIAAVVTLVAVIAFHRLFLALSFNFDKAASLGMRPRLAHIAMLTHCHCDRGLIPHRGNAARLRAPHCSARNCCAARSPSSHNDGDRLPHRRRVNLHRPHHHLSLRHCCRRNDGRHSRCNLFHRACRTRTRKSRRPTRASCTRMSS